MSQSDRLRSQLGVLDREIPPEVVDEVIDQTGRGERRRRLLPAQRVVYFVLAMCLFAAADSLMPPGYRSVMRSLTSAVSRMAGLVVPSPTALTKARKRLGVDPLRVLFDRLCRPRATAGTPGAYLWGRRLVAFDGTILDLANTAENVAAFGYAGSAGGCPQVRLVAVSECGTRALLGAAFDAGKTSEKQLVSRLMDLFGPGMLVLADRNFGRELFCQVAETGADLLWRARVGDDYPVLQVLADGSFLSALASAEDKRRYRRQLLRPGQARASWPGSIVRVIDYRVTRHRSDGTTQTSPVRLVTTMLDPQPAPAQQLAEAYHERWEAENGYADLKTRLRGAGFPLRSKLPDLVQQEIYAFLIVYQLLSALRTDAAAAAGVDPDRVSFTVTIRVARDTVTAGPHRRARVLAINDITSDLLPARRQNRIQPRVKRPPKPAYPARRPNTRPPRHATIKITISHPAIQPP